MGGSNNRALTKALDGVQEFARLGPHVAMQRLCSLMVENAQVHPLGVLARLSLAIGSLESDEHDAVEP